MEVTEKTQSNVDIEELEIRLGLLEDCQEVCAKFTVDAFKRWKEPVAAFLRDTFPVFSSIQISEVVWQTFLELPRAVRGKEFDIEKPLYGLILTIANRRGRDEYRKSKRFVIETDEFIDAVYNRIHGTDVEEEWKVITEEGKEREIQLEYRKFLAQLPPSQRIIAKIIDDNLPIALAPAEIVQKVFEATGEFLTAVQVKGRLQALRQKFKVICRKRLSIKLKC